MSAAKALSKTVKTDKNTSKLGQIRPPFSQRKAVTTCRLRHRAIRGRAPGDASPRLIVYRPLSRGAGDREVAVTRPPQRSDQDVKVKL